MTSTTMEQIKGKLIAIGGAEDKGTEMKKIRSAHHNLNFFELGILRRIVEEAGGVDARIEVITTASQIPLEVGNNYLEAFGRIGCTNIGVMHIRNRRDADNEDYLERVRSCDAVMFSGGDQMRLAKTYIGRPMLKIILERYTHENFIVAGTSAGAMAMSRIMIYEGEASRGHLKGEVKLATGLDFMNNVIFDSHFEKRGRFVRLSQAVSLNPTNIGIGLGEDTGMLVTEGNQMEAIGSGMIVIIDGHNIQHCNIALLPEGNPLSVENLRVHLLAKGNGYLVQERRFVEQMLGEAVVAK